MQLPLLLPELAQPAVPAEIRGVVYTRRWVVELLLDLAGYRSENNLSDAVAVEPSAGDGAFLVPMVERLVQSCKSFGRSLSECEDCLVAYELDESSADRARALAITALTNHGVERPLADRLGRSWVRTGDYLFESTSVEADFVIGNPPYVRLEDIPLEIAALYRNSYPTMRGRADLYVAFFEAALRQLKEGGGACAFICADRWMRNHRYGATRTVTSGFDVEVVIEMHNADAFHEEVDAYPAITVIRRQKQGPAVSCKRGTGSRENNARRSLCNAAGYGTKRIGGFAARVSHSTSGVLVHGGGRLALPFARTTGAPASARGAICQTGIERQGRDWSCNW